jgi:hypothetical protein
VGFETSWNQNLIARRSAAYLELPARQKDGDPTSEIPEKTRTKRCSLDLCR